MSELPDGLTVGHSLASLASLRGERTATTRQNRQIYTSPRPWGVVDVLSQMRQLGVIPGGAS